MTTFNTFAERFCTATTLMKRFCTRLLGDGINGLDEWTPIVRRWYWTWTHCIPYSRCHRISSGKLSIQQLHCSLVLWLSTSAVRTHRSTEASKKNRWHDNKKDVQFCKSAQTLFRLVIMNGRHYTQINCSTVNNVHHSILLKGGFLSTHLMHLSIGTSNPPANTLTHGHISMFPLPHSRCTTHTRTWARSLFHIRIQAQQMQQSWISSTIGRTHDHGHTNSCCYVI